MLCRSVFCVAASGEEGRKSRESCVSVSHFSRCSLPVLSTGRTQRSVVLKFDSKQFLVQGWEFEAGILPPELRKAFHVKCTDFPQFWNLCQEDVQDTDVAFHRLMALA